MSARACARSGVILCAWVVACTSKGSASPGGDSAATAREESATASAPVPAAPSTSAAPAEHTTHWTGKYKSGVGAFYVPDAEPWSKYNWRGDDGGDGLGDGTLSLTIDGAARTVTGVAGGAIGDALISGVLAGQEITASVRRKDPNDRGLTGTLVATSSPSKIEGTMRLSFGDAHVLRAAAFSLESTPNP